MQCAAMIATLVVDVFVVAVLAFDEPRDVDLESYDRVRADFGANLGLGDGRV
jgi:hypothetical protein